MFMGAQNYKKVNRIRVMHWHACSRTDPAPDAPVQRVRFVSHPKGREVRLRMKYHESATAVPQSFHLAIGSTVSQPGRSHENHTRPLSMEEEARQFKVTPQHLCRVFRATTGRTPLEFLHRERV